MIQWMHQLSKSWVATLLMGLLAASFVVWGIADVFVGAPDTTAIKVGGTVISAQDFANYYKRVKQRMGPALTDDDARRQGLPKLAEQELASDIAMENLGQDMGTGASLESAVATIRGMKVFAGLNGSFDRNVFLEKIQTVGYSENEFIAEAQRELTNSRLEKSIVAGFETPLPYALSVLAYANEKRAADYIVVTPAMAGAIPTPSDAVLAAYVKAHAERFSAPEYRDVSYAVIAPQDVASQIQVTDAQIEQEYALHKADYIKPETRELEQLEFPTQALAQAARARIAGGASFESLAGGQNISLGTLTMDEIPDPDRAKAAFSLALNDVSQPVKGTFGWVLLRATKITPGTSQALAEVRDKIKAELATQLAQSKMTDIANAFSDARAGGDDIDAAAKKVGMRSGHVAAMDASGLDPDGKKVDVAADPDFLANVFKAEVAEDNDPFLTKAGVYYAVLVNKAVPPRLKPLAAVRAEALAAWTSEQRQIRIRARTQALAALARTQPLSVIAKSLGVPVQKSAGLGRNLADKTFSANLLHDLFAAKPNGIIAGADADGSDYVVAQLTGIAHPRPTGGRPYMEEVEREFSREIAADMPVALANAARVKQGVTVNQKVIDSAVGNGS